MPFQHLVREIIKWMTATQYLSVESIAALQEATEACFIGLFEETHLCAIHVKKVAIMPKDTHIIRCIFEERT